MPNMLSCFATMGMFVAAMNFAISGALASEPAAARAIEPQAKQHLEAGVKALQAKRWENARDELLQAWQTDKHYRIAANLGLVEIELHQYRDAAEHLAFCLRAETDMPANRKAAVQKLFDDARTHVGMLDVRTTSEGAAILVNGEVAGRAPLHAFFVEPGERTITARMPGKTFEEKAIEIAAGEDVELVIAELPPPAPIPPDTTQHLAPSNESISNWKYVAIPAGAVVTAAGLGVGIGCAGSLSPGISPELRNERTVGAAIGFSISGVALVTTVVMALWPEEEQKRTGFFVSPIIGRAENGVLVGGAF